jgi:signal transduction histidine kinase
MAQVLNTLAHEIRTPLAVSQGYLKLYADGRLATPDAQQRALQQTREALGVIAVLCTDMSKVSALAESGEPVLAERLAATALAEGLKGAPDLAEASWTDTLPTGARIATNAPADLVRAVGVVIKMAFDDDKGSPHAVDLSTHGHALVIRAGTQAALNVLSHAPDGPGASAVDIARGGKGLSLIWATFVAEQHRIQMWNHQAHKASVGLRIPLVSA